MFFDFLWSDPGFGSRPGFTWIRDFFSKNPKHWLLPEVCLCFISCIYRFELDVFFTYRISGRQKYWTIWETSTLLIMRIWETGKKPSRSRKVRYVALFLYNVKTFYVRTLSNFFSVSILFNVPVFFLLCLDFTKSDMSGSSPSYMAHSKFVWDTH